MCERRQTVDSQIAVTRLLLDIKQLHGVIELRQIITARHLQTLHSTSGPSAADWIGLACLE
jgi:hypothetical protein